MLYREIKLHLACRQQVINLLHSEWPKLYGVLAVLSELGLKNSHNHQKQVYTEETVSIWATDKISYKVGL